MIAFAAGFGERPAGGQEAGDERPNIVLIFADDLAYGDLGCYGAEGYETPHLDRMAAEGVRLTDFYVAQAVCSASRAALLTGCYSNRVGITGALGPAARHGIHADEVTIAELLKGRGYATGVFGKWHLGHRPQFLPTRHGFDEYFGLPYSNDMWPKHPEIAKAFPELPLMEGGAVAEIDPDQAQLTRRYTERAVRFIEQHKEEPFFLYLPHSMPHVPLAASDAFRGKTERGLFGDVIAEIDWSVGQVLSTIDRLGLDERTLVLFTSDNGPWLSYGDHAGQAAPLREGKGTTFEGGVRVPCVARWPEKIPAGRVCREPAMTIDILPTVARLAGAPLPADRIIDGRDVWPLLAGENDARSPHEALYFYWGGELQAVRSGRWKLHLPHAYRRLPQGGGTMGKPTVYEQASIGLSLFDLDADPGETTNVAGGHPDVVARLEELAEQARDDLGDTGTKRQPKNARPRGELAGRRPNILFVFTDDHAAHAISAYGSRINQTPNIDRLARGGMLFRNCFATNSLCAPSRAVVLTGKHSHLNGVIDNRAVFDSAQQTFPKLLRQAGYQTALVGKWHLKSDPTGFDHWAVLSAAGGQGTYYNPQIKTAEGTAIHTGYTTDIITDMAMEWLQADRDMDKPFLLMYQHKAPHREWAPSLGHLRLYEDEGIPEPETLFDDYSRRSSAAGLQTMTIERDLNEFDLKLKPPANLTREQLEAWNAAYEPANEAFRRANLSGRELVRWKYQRYIKDYLRTIASVDENLGRVLDYLDQSGLAQDTVVVYSSDQGFFLGEHGWYDKRWMYEESLRMPLIVRWPGVVRAGSVDEHLVQNLDFAPTFLEIAGVGIPPDMQGRSLVGLLKESAADDWRTSVYYHFYEFPGVHDVRRHRGIRTDRYKLIHFYELDEWELFDLRQDPRELESVYDDPGRAALVAELKQALAKQRQLVKE
jgi:arylsulfatase A-like enzyme